MHSVYTILLYLNGNTQVFPESGPDVVLQDVLPVLEPPVDPVLPVLEPPVDPALPVLEPPADPVLPVAASA